jgi:hypothetical protein
MTYFEQIWGKQDSTRKKKVSMFTTELIQDLSLEHIGGIANLRKVSEMKACLYIFYY